MEVVAGQPVVLVVQTQSPAWRWNIAVTQVSRAAPVLLPTAALLQVSRQEIAASKQDLQQVAAAHLDIGLDWIAENQTVVWVVVIVRFTSI